RGHHQDGLGESALLDLCRRQGRQRKGCQLALRNGSTECSTPDGLAEGLCASRHASGDPGISSQVRWGRCQRETSQVTGWPRALFRRLCPDRKSTRLNSSHVAISYAVFCLKKKKKKKKDKNYTNKNKNTI